MFFQKCSLLWYTNPKLYIIITHTLSQFANFVLFYMAQHKRPNMYNILKLHKRAITIMLRLKYKEATKDNYKQKKYLQCIVNNDMSVSSLQKWKG